MPNMPIHRARRRQTTKEPAQSPDVTQAASPRLARRKRETRIRLLDATFILLAEKGMEGVTINDITNAADVGFGSFYNHFDSKEGIFAALVEWLFEEFATALDHLASGLSDPAEVIAVSVRHTLLHAYREPIWGQLLMREALSARALSMGLGQRLLRDAERGISERRFLVSDALMCVISVTGTVLAGIAAQLRFSASSRRTRRLKTMGRSREEKFAQSTAAIVLQAFGLARMEAEKIARRPLPASHRGPTA
ncbi:TetR/AcrR family transcriptional regulator [Caballeronia ptereochthonis]|uniref:TetR family transcriptional regulator n=1 Tax=Caballeronia ptereochthonis TaxID=1777144 RepID=A0A158AKD8_9BURK|nr:TetR/AcrR family transcriptional regulator [Caballeronia ptereochthonis]SAK58046.1 TetR family transcriptional regulator [Caballeronia ptereochthonis]